MNLLDLVTQTTRRSAVVDRILEKHQRDLFEDRFLRDPHLATLGENVVKYYTDKRLWEGNGRKSCGFNNICK